MITPFFLHPDSLSRDRYIAILKFLPFSDPYHVDTDNKNTRVMDFLSLLEEIFSQYVPDQSLALDKSLILFKGRLSIKLFIRTKRARFGLKLFVLADKNGYMIKSLLYVGSTTCFDSNESNTEHLT